MNNNKIFQLIVFISTFCVYILTLAPGLNYTDSGEFASVAYSFGISHPSGYPLFSILSKLWLSIIPFGTVIYKVNLLGAIWVSLANLTIYNIFKTIGEKFSSNQFRLEINSLFFSLAFGFTNLVWTQATSIEIYSLHLLLNSLTIYFAILAYYNGPKYFYITSVLLGLSFTNHLTSFLLIPFIFYLYFKSDAINKNERWNNFKILIPLFIIPLSLYLFLPIRSSANPLFNWGDVDRGFDKFLYHITGKQYQIWMFEGKEAWGKNLKIFFEVVFSSLIYIFLIPLFFTFKGISKNKSLIYGLLILLFSNLLYNINYNIHDIQNYFLVALLTTYIFVYIGTLNLFEKYGNVLKNNFVIIALPLVLVSFNYKENDMSKFQTLENYNIMMTEQIDKNAIVFSQQWDYWISSFWYKQKVEGFRPDIVLIDKELLRRTWYYEQLKTWYPWLYKQNQKEIEQFLEQLELFESERNYDPILIQNRFIAMINSIVDKNIDTKPIYFTYEVLETEKGIAQNYNRIPEGLALRISKDTSFVKRTSLKNFDNFFNNFKMTKNHLDTGIVSAIENTYINVASYSYFYNDTSTAITISNQLTKYSTNNPTVLNFIERINAKQK